MIQSVFKYLEIVSYIYVQDGNKDSNFQREYRYVTHCHVIANLKFEMWFIKNRMCNVHFDLHLMCVCDSNELSDCYQLIEICNDSRPHMYYKRNYVSCMLYVFRYVLCVILNSIDKFRKKKNQMMIGILEVDFLTINRYLLW